MTTVLYYVFQIVKNSGITKKTVTSKKSPSFAQRAFNCTSLGFALAKCEGNGGIQQLKSESLTHEQCIKQACLLSVNSASTLLTTTSSALLDICNNYKESLNKILYLLDRVQSIEGEHPELWDEIVEARANVNSAKASLSKVNSYMESVEKVVMSTSEAAFLAGADYMCTVLCERLHSAQQEIFNRIAELKKLEEDYIKMQGEIVSNKEKVIKNKEQSSEISKIKVKIDKNQFLQQ